MKKFVSSRCTPLSSAILIGTCATVAMLYITDDKAAEVMGKNYFDPEDPYLRDRTLMRVVSEASSDKLLVSEILVAKIDVKATKKKAAHRKIVVTPIGGGGEAAAPYDDTELRKAVEDLQAAATKPAEDPPVKDPKAASKDVR